MPQLSIRVNLTVTNAQFDFTCDFIGQVPNSMGGTVTADCGCLGVADGTSQADLDDGDSFAHVAVCNSLESVVCFPGFVKGENKDTFSP
jgi:hypothetical protein